MRGLKTKVLLGLLGVVTRRLLHTGTNALSLLVRDHDGDGGETLVAFERRWDGNVSTAATANATLRWEGSE